MRSLNAILYDLEISFRATLQRNANSKSCGRTSDTIDLFLCLVDHFEPQVGKADKPLARKRLEDWIERYPKIAERHTDADGRVPAHSFFYPWDEYDDWEFEKLQELCKAGFGEIEVHLHHRDDTEETLKAKFSQALETFSRHGALSFWPDGKIAWAFIHGNWALDNSRGENGRNYCGVNSEIRLLREMGCYADFTFPAWNQTAQPRMTNQIFYATDDPEKPKSHDFGIPAEAGRTGEGDLLLIQGPLVPYIKRCGGPPRPAVDDGDIASYRRYDPARLDRWVQSCIHVKGRPDRIFVKLHSHGAADANREAMLGKDLEQLFVDAESRYNDGERFRLHYVSAREMFNVIKATEAEAVCSIAAARDWVLKKR